MFQDQPLHPQVSLSFLTFLHTLILELDNVSGSTTTSLGQFILNISLHITLLVFISLIFNLHFFISLFFVVNFYSFIHFFIRQSSSFSVIYVLISCFFVFSFLFSLRSRLISQQFFTSFISVFLRYLYSILFARYDPCPPGSVSCSTVQWRDVFTDTVRETCQANTLIS